MCAVVWHQLPSDSYHEHEHSEENKGEGEGDGGQHKEDGEEEGEDDARPRAAGELAHGDDDEQWEEGLHGGVEPKETDGHAVEADHVRRIDGGHEELGEMHPGVGGAVAQEEIPRAGQEEEHDDLREAGVVGHLLAYGIDYVVEGLFLIVRDVDAVGRCLAALGVVVVDVDVDGGLVAARQVVAVTEVEAAVHDERESGEEEEHLERREVGALHAAQVVADHVAGAEDEVAHAVDHALVAQTPHVDEEEKHGLERIAAHP